MFQKYILILVAGAQSKKLIPPGPKELCVGNSSQIEGKSNRTEDHSSRRSDVSESGASRERVAHGDRAESTSMNLC